MKRILFYLLLAFQIVVISFIAIQYMLIDDYGKTVKILQEEPESDNDYYPEDELYLDYEINYLSETNWDVPSDMKNNDKVYVLLEADKAGIYHVMKASKDKLEAKQDQVVLVGKYERYASSSGRTRIDYGIERIPQNETYSQLDRNKQWIITLKIASWGQNKVVNIEEK